MIFAVQVVEVLLEMGEQCTGVVYLEACSADATRKYFILSRRSDLGLVRFCAYRSASYRNPRKLFAQREKAISVTQLLRIGGVVGNP